MAEKKEKMSVGEAEDLEEQMLVSTAFKLADPDRDKPVSLRMRGQVTLDQHLLYRAADYGLDHVRYHKTLPKEEAHYISLMFQSSSVLQRVRRLTIQADVSVEAITLFPAIRRLDVDVSNLSLEKRSQVLANVTASLSNLLQLATMELKSTHSTLELRRLLEAVAQQPNITGLVWEGEEWTEGDVEQLMPTLPYVTRFESNCPFVKEVAARLPKLRDFVGHYQKRFYVAPETTDEPPDAMYRLRISSELLDMLVARAKTLESFEVKSDNVYTNAEKWTLPTVPSGVKMERLQKFQLLGADVYLARFAARNLLGAVNKALTVFEWDFEAADDARLGMLKQLDDDTHISTLSLPWSHELGGPRLTRSEALRMPITTLYASPWVLSKGDESLLGFTRLQDVVLFENSAPGGLEMVKSFLNLIGKHPTLESFSYTSHNPERQTLALYVKTMANAIATLPLHVRSFTWNIQRRGDIRYGGFASHYQAELLEALTKNRGLVEFNTNHFYDLNTVPHPHVKRVFQEFLSVNETLVILNMPLLFDLSKWEEPMRTSGTTLEYLKGYSGYHGGGIETPYEIQKICVENRLRRRAMLSKQAASMAMARAYLATAGHPLRTSFAPLMKSVSELADLPYSVQLNEDAEKYAQTYYKFTVRDPAVRMPPTAQAALQHAQATERVLANRRARKRRR